jgi:hypothetical protein
MGDSDVEYSGDEKPDNQRSRGRASGSRKKTDSELIREMLANQKKIMGILAAMQGKQESLAQSISELKRDFLIIQRSLPTMRTAGPTGHFQQSFLGTD